jgi:Transglycosylase SLT domain
MAESGFTRELQDPGNFGAGDSRNYGRSGTASAIGAGLGGLASLLDVGLKQHRIERFGEESKDLFDKLYDETQKYASQPKAPGLLSETTTAEQQEAMGSPLYRNTQRELERIRQGNVQGTISQAEFFARTSAILKNAIDTSPEFTGEFQALGQRVLGTDSLAKQVALASASEEAENKAEELADANSATYANSNGIWASDDKGNYDLKKTAKLGRDLAFKDAQLDRDLKRLEVESKRNPALSKAELDSEKESTVINGFSDIFTVHSSSMIDKTMALLKTRTGTNDPEILQAIEVGVGKEKAGWMLYVNQNLDKMKNLDAGVRKNIMENEERRFKVYEDLAKGDLSQVEARARALKQLKDQVEFDAIRAAPAVAAGRAALGDTAISGMVNTAVGVSTRYRSVINKDLAKLFGNESVRVDAATHIYDAADVGAGIRDFLSFEHEPRRLVGALATSSAALDDYYKRPNELSTGEQQAFGNTVVALSRLGLTSKNPDDVLLATGRLNSARATQTFKAFAKNPANAHLLNPVANSMMNMNGHNLTTQSNFLQERRVEGVFGGEVGILNPASQGADFSAVFNPNNGQVELVSTREQVVPLVGRTPTPSEELLKRVDSVNKSLEAMGVLKDFTGGIEAELNPLQMKQVAAAGAGIPNKQGTKPVEMPQPQQAAPSVKKAEKKGTTWPIGEEHYGSVVVKAAAETGVPEGILRWKIGQESQWDPNARSESSSAGGISQFIDSTAKSLKIDKFNPYEAIPAGAQYLKDRFKDTGDYVNDWLRALADYGTLARRNWPRTPKGEKAYIETVAEARLAIEQSKPEEDVRPAQAGMVP